MSSVLLAPHHDDETLFAAFTIMRERPKVIVVLESHLQEQRGNTYTTGWGWQPRGHEETRQQPITNDVRQLETEDAMANLGVITLYDTSRLEFWPFRDDAPDWGAIAERIVRETAEADHVYAPATTFEGHEHHNALGEIVAEVIGYSKRTFYTTYVRGTPDVREQGDTEVKPEPWMVAAKLRALACYRSQIELWPHHFLADQREFYG